MERLIRSNPISLHSIPQLPRRPQLATCRDNLRGFPCRPLSESRRVKSVSCFYQGLPSNSLHLSKKSGGNIDYFDHNSFPAVDSANGLSKEIRVVGKVAEFSVNGRKEVLVIGSLVGGILCSKGILVHGIILFVQCLGKGRAIYA